MWLFFSCRQTRICQGIKWKNASLPRVSRQRCNGQHGKYSGKSTNRHGIHRFFEHTIGLHVNGKAKIIENDELLADKTLTSVTNDTQEEGVVPALDIYNGWRGLCSLLKTYPSPQKTWQKNSLGDRQGNPQRRRFLQSRNLRLILTSIKAKHQNFAIFRAINHCKS